MGADSRATSPAREGFNFKQPRAFVAIKAPKDQNFFLHQKPDLRPPDDE